MRLLMTAILLVLSATAGLAQQPAAAPAADALKMFQTSADIGAIVARLKAQPAQPLRSAPMFTMPGYRVNIEYRTAVAPAAIHETEAELFTVIDGGGTFVIGGQLTEQTRQNAQNLQGKSITGGTSRKVSKGDFMLVPAGSAHGFSAIDGTITLMSLHLPIQK
ncbi:MAG TPA: cupin domain-containing protein [Vicinamibacterales bacterium]|nr:cupin domain-containing protein [Vicinamibacterales bacterium]